MAKERMLTILVPIKKGDYTEWLSSVPPTLSDFKDTNTIYKYGDLFYRKIKDENTGLYAIGNPIDREFPYIGKPLEIFDFTYDATRMGTAPTISAQSIMWYADKDDDGNDVTLENMWSQDCHVEFCGENFYLKQIPTSSKSNEDARYKYDIDFIAERVVLETTYLYDVVTPFITETPISESATFSFYGDIEELAKRINASLLRSGLTTVALRDNQVEQVHPRLLSDNLTHAANDQFFTYEEWNAIGQGTYNGILSVEDPYNAKNIYGDYEHFHNNIFEHYGGDYNAYLRHEVYLLDDNGNLSLNGYVCKIGRDKKGEITTSEEKLISFDKNTIHEALQQFHDTFELQYYIYREQDENGKRTGNTIIVVGDCQHDFADMKADGTDFVRNDNDIPMSTHPFDYGVDKALLSKEKSNTTEQIITRITGVGSSENIPWYYPNPMADGWIKPVFKTAGEEQNKEVDYPLSFGETTASNVRYEKYLKNRIGDVFAWGYVKQFLDKTDYKEQSGLGYYEGEKDESVINLIYAINVKSGYANPRVVFNISAKEGSGTGRMRALLHDNTANVDVDAYDSDSVYENPTAFQRAMRDNDKNIPVGLTAGHIYYLYLSFVLDDKMPYSQEYDYEGYYYPATKVENNHDGPDCNIPSEFYEDANLLVAATWQFWSAPDFFIPAWGGFSLNGTFETRQSPLARVKGKRYKDKMSNIIYECVDTTVVTSATLQSTKHAKTFKASPLMDFEEWVKVYLSFSVKIYEADGWYKKTKKQTLSDYGIENEEALSLNADINDTIEFRRVKYITPQPNLMPEVYIKTDGEKRFYNAINYYDRENNSLKVGTADTLTGEEQVGTQKRNPLYKEKEDDSDDKHYQFENEYLPVIPHEHIEDFDDIKPTIKGQLNFVKTKPTQEQFDYDKTAFYTMTAQSEYVQCTKNDVYNSAKTYYSRLRIDVIDCFEFDELDNNEVWESNDNGNVSGDYKHPYFFARLRPLGFNIFDLALQEDMVLSMTTGYCGACNFKIAVDSNTKKNPVQIWEYDVYAGSSYADKGKLLYEAGSLRRYKDDPSLYYDTDGTEEGYKPINAISGAVGFLVDGVNRGTFVRATYSAEQVTLGEVGSLKQEKKTHFDGDVLTSGRFIASQQDTSENFVWVALEKDTDTYGTLMPSALPDYGDNSHSIFIDPKGHRYYDRKAKEWAVLDDDDADKFVITNIRLPQVYIRRAERDLSRQLIAYMYDKNYQKFDFSITFSRIFLAENEDIDAKLNENSVLYISFNNKVYRQYVKHYAYKMSADAVLPEITIDLNEELNVTKTFIEQQAAMQTQYINKNNRRLIKGFTTATDNLSKRVVDKNSDTIINGNLVSRDANMSFGELSAIGVQTAQGLQDTQLDIEVNHYKRSDFKLCNGSDLRIGEEITLTVPYINDNVIKQNVWDNDEEAFKIGDKSISTVTTGNFNATNFDTWASAMTSAVTVLKSTILGQQGNIACEYDEATGNYISVWYDINGNKIETKDGCYILSIPVYSK